MKILASITLLMSVPREGNDDMLLYTRSRWHTYQNNKKGHLEMNQKLFTSTEIVNIIPVVKAVIFNSSNMYVLTCNYSSDPRVFCLSARPGVRAFGCGKLSSGHISMHSFPQQACIRNTDTLRETPKLDDPTRLCLLPGCSQVEETLSRAES